MIIFVDIMEITRPAALTPGRMFLFPWRHESFALPPSKGNHFDCNFQSTPHQRVYAIALPIFQSLCHVIANLSCKRVRTSPRIEEWMIANRRFSSLKAQQNILPKIFLSFATHLQPHLTASKRVVASKQR